MQSKNVNIVLLNGMIYRFQGAGKSIQTAWSTQALGSAGGGIGGGGGGGDYFRLSG